MANATAARGDPESLRLESDRFRQVLEMSLEGVWMLDAAWITTFANRRLLQILGYERSDEVVGRSLLDFVPVADHARTRARMANRFRGAAEMAEYSVLRKDGSTIRVAARSVPLKDAFANVDCVFVTLSDITAHHDAAMSRDRLAAIVESSDGAIMSVDRSHLITSWNRGAVELFGYTPEEAIGAKASSLVPPGLLEEHDRLMATVEAGGHVGHYETQRVRKDGSTVDVSIALSAVRDASGAIVEVSKIIRDLTRERRTEAALQRTEEQLQQSQKMEAIGRLAGGVAHDFNNMLSVILSYTDLATGDLPREDPMRADLKEVRDAGLRASELTKQLLAFSRQQILQPVVLDFRQAILAMRKFFERLVGEHIELAFFVSSSTGHISADPTQIEQVVMNLVVNARDAMPKGGKLTIEARDVEIEADYVATHEGVTAGPHVMLAVTDTGVGMDEKTIAQIFDPFFTTKPKDKGTGLGLSTTYGIVKQSGGHIWVYSEPGKGTTFKVYFPTCGRPLAQTQSFAPDPTGSLDGDETILLVEDDEHVRTITKAILARHGYDVLEAKNGGEALLLCEERLEPIHLLITDVVMPMMSGRRLAERLAPLRPEMPVLYISGYTDNTIVHHGVVDVGISFLSKPIMPEALLRKVREVLGAPTSAPGSPRP